MKRSAALVLAILGTLSFSTSLRSANPKLENEVITLAANGLWDRALAKLEKAPEAQTDTAMKEMLAMSYLYTASRVDTRENFLKAQTMMREMVSQGGRARFKVSLGQDPKKEKHLVESVPGEIIVTSNSVEFQPHPEMKMASTKWEKSILTECGANPKYGSSSRSFHFTATQGKDKTEFNFRPLHNSAEEVILICSLAVGDRPAPTGKK